MCKWLPLMMRMMNFKEWITQTGSLSSQLQAIWIAHQTSCCVTCHDLIQPLYMYGVESVPKITHGFGWPHMVQKSQKVSRCMGQCFRTCDKVFTCTTKFQNGWQAVWQRIFRAVVYLDLPILIPCRGFPRTSAPHIFIVVALFKWEYTNPNE